MKHVTVANLVLLITITQGVLAQNSTGTQGGYGASCRSGNDCSPGLKCDLKKGKPRICVCISQQTPQCSQHVVDCTIPTSNLSQWRCDVLAQQLIINSLQVIDGAVNATFYCNGNSSCLYTLPQPVPAVSHDLVVNLTHRYNDTSDLLSVTANSYSVKCKPDIIRNGMRECEVALTRQNQVGIGSLTVQNNSDSEICNNSLQCSYRVPDLPPMTKYSVEVLLLVTAEGKTSNYTHQIYDYIPPKIINGSLTQTTGQGSLNVQWVQFGSVKDVKAKVFEKDKYEMSNRQGKCHLSQDKEASAQNVTCRWDDLEPFTNYSTMNMSWQHPAELIWIDQGSFDLPSPYLYPNPVRGVNVTSVSSISAVITIYQDTDLRQDMYRLQGYTIRSQHTSIKCLLKPPNTSLLTCAGQYLPKQECTLMSGNILATTKEELVVSLDNLRPSTQYNFELTPLFVLFDQKVCKTSVSTYSGPFFTTKPEIKTVNVTTTGPKEILVTWEVDDDHPNVTYTVYVTSEPVKTASTCEAVSQSWLCTTNSSTRANSCKGRVNVNFWQYNINVVANSNGANFSICKEVAYSDKQAEAAVDGVFILENVTSVSMEITVVEKFNVSVEALRYLVEASHPHFGCLILYKTAGANTSCKEQLNRCSRIHTKTIQQTVAWTRNLTVVLDDLRPSTLYNFSLTPLFCHNNISKYGSLTNFGPQNTSHAVMAITNVTTATSEIRVTWDTTVAHPDVTYSVYVEYATDADSQNERFSQRKEFLCSVESSKTAKNNCSHNFSIRAFWEYVITVSAVSTRINITSSSSLVVTPPSRPGKVYGLTVLRHNDSDLNCSGEIIANYSAACVTWSDVIPEERNSFIANYTITVTSRSTIKDNRIVESKFGLLTSNLTAYRLDRTPATYWVVVRIKPNDTNTITVRANDDGIPATETFYVEVPAPAMLEQAEVEKNVPNDKIVPSGDGKLEFLVNNATFFFKDNKGHRLQKRAIVIKTGTLPPPRVDSEAVDNYTDYENRHGDQAKDHGFRVDLDIKETEAPQTLVLGSEDCSNKTATSKYCNGPLDAGETYSVWGVLCNDVNCGVLVLVKEATIPKEDETPSWVTTLIGIGVVIASLLVILIVYRCCYYERRLPKESNLSEWTQIEQRSKRPMKLAALEAVIARKQRDNNLLLREEYEDLIASTKGVKAPHTVGVSEKNRVKNRWTNIVTYDHSRVKISKCEDGSDYINANFIPGYNREDEYIATQGPLPVTINHFWKMVWEYDVPVVVMLTQTREEDKVKCEQYWPEQKNDAVQYGDIVVTNLHCHSLGDYNITNLALRHVKNKKKELKVHHFQYLHWVDLTASLTPEAMTNFISDVRQHHPAKSAGPTVVHCSAGVGRTGTYIAIDYAMQLINQQPLNAELDIYGYIMRLRQARVLMVQTENQYILIHMCARFWMTAQREKAALENGTGMTRASSMSSLQRQSAEVKRMTHFGPVSVMDEERGAKVTTALRTAASQDDLDVTRMTYMDEEERDEAETDVDMGLVRRRPDLESIRNELYHRWQQQENGNNGNSESSLLLP